MHIARNDSVRPGLRSTLSGDGDAPQVLRLPPSPALDYPGRRRGATALFPAESHAHVAVGHARISVAKSCGNHVHQFASQRQRRNSSRLEMDPASWLDWRASGEEDEVGTVWARLTGAATKKSSQRRFRPRVK